MFCSLSMKVSTFSIQYSNNYVQSTPHTVIDVTMMCKASINIRWGESDQFSHSTQIFTWNRKLFQIFFSRIYEQASGYLIPFLSRGREKLLIYFSVSQVYRWDLYMGFSYNPIYLTNRTHSKIRLKLNFSHVKQNNRLSQILLIFSYLFPTTIKRNYLTTSKLCVKKSNQFLSLGKQRKNNELLNINIVVSLVL